MDYPCHMGGSVRRSIDRNSHFCHARYIFAIAFLIANIRAKQINTLHNSVNKMEKILYTYSSLIKSIEGDIFKSSELVTISGRFNGPDGTASRSLKSYPAASEHSTNGSALWESS